MSVASLIDTDPTEPIAPPTIRVERVATTDDYLISIHQPDTPTTLPVLFIDVLDISGSMGATSSSNTTTDAALFSRADLVRHSVATQIELLRPQDELAIVLFDHNSTIALLPTADRATARTALTQISAVGGTNIWSGLFKALQIAEERITSSEAATENVVILLQTDGQSDPTYNPPRGIVPTLLSWMDAHPAVRLTIHTIGYGMGGDLDTPLLRSIADATGGTTNYIPDGSMVGTVFIHLMANLMSVVHKELVFQIPEIGYSHNIGFLQADQVREFLVPIPSAAASPLTVCVRDPNCVLATTTIADLTTLPTVPPGFPHAVAATLRELRLALIAAETHPAVLLNPLTTLRFTLRALLETDSSHRMMALLTDVDDKDPARGQICKAFESVAAYNRWGRHYIPMVISSLQNAWAINFKDALSTEVFGTGHTHDLVARGDAIFTTLPPPTSTVGSRYGRAATAASTAPVSMASIHSSAGPCFLPGSLVRMADGTEKRCDQIRPGDRDAAGYTIQCVIKTLVPYADIVRLTGLLRPDITAPIPDDVGFTLWHPVINPATGEWAHPATIGPVEHVRTDAIYNFVLKEENNPLTGKLERPGMLIINGIQTCTMAHNFCANAVIEHPYFGAARPGYRHILEDLRQQPGWEHGYITWSNLHVSHDATTGMITGMRPL